MPINYLKRTRTLAKEVRFDNCVCKTSSSILIILLILCANLAQSAPILASISWREAPTAKQTYLLEVSDDGRFGTSLLKVEVSGSSYKWEAPKEGVYHWRVIPMTRLKLADGAESSSFASGSFVALDAEGPGLEKSLEIRWTPDVDATAYHLLVQLHGVQKFKWVSLKPAYTLTRSPASQVIQVTSRSRASSSKIALDAVSRFDPALTIVRPTPAAVETTPRELIVGNEPIPASPPPLELLPLPEPPKPVKFDETRRPIVVEDDSIPDQRLSEIMLLAYGGSENTYASKLSKSSHSKQNVTGGMLTYRASPTTALHLFAEASGHGRQAKWENENGLENSGQPISIFTGQAGLGFDTFFRNPNRRHILVLEVRGAIGQLPISPIEPTNLETELAMTSTQLAGLGLWYRWTLRNWGVGLFGSSLIQTVDRSESNDTTLDQWGGFLAFDPIKYVTLNFGATSRVATVKRCHDDKLRCEQEGVSKTRNSSVVGYVGLGYVFY